MGRIIFNGHSLSFEEIKAGHLPETEITFLSALRFCQDWLMGKDSFLLHTSGSTGNPKPITVSRQQMEASAKGTAQALNLCAGDTALVCLNTSYIAGLMMLVRGMVIGMDLILVPPVSSPLREIKRQDSLDFAAFVPLQLQTILREQNPDDLSLLNQMKAIIVGGAAPNDELEEMTGGLSAPVFITYGMTETVSHIALRRLNGKEKEEDYKTLPHVSIDLDERGCLKILAPVTQNQWIQTNDVVVLTGKNSFRWLGRADYTINSGGVKIQPEKVEALLGKLLSENGFSCFFIAGLPHPQLGEAVTLFVESNAEPNEALQEKIRSQVDRFQLPKAILCIPSFPKTATGKIERSRITHDFQEYFFKKH